MNQDSKSIVSSRRAGVTAVHSVDRIVFTVPAIEPAEAFYTAFGLDVRRSGQSVNLFTHGNAHCWMSIHANGQPRALHYISFGIFAEDEEAFRKKIAQLKIGCEPQPLADTTGLWLRSPDGTPIQLVVTNKVSPNSKSPASAKPAAARRAASAPMRSLVPKVVPRWLSHVLLFTADVPRLLQFCEDVLGLCLSDRSGDFVAFMHTPHGSDHHLLAFVQSNGAGLHHTSWDVGSLDDVGQGSEQMRNAGFADGWGVGRHVLGSNYFYYARDPWGGFAEYSFDIDFIPSNADWIAGDYAPHDSFYLWGPAVPEWFTHNPEAEAQAAKVPVKS
jgi:catechol 2,3-dioxygenase-like lactoylglutathione lyase family enzyme